MQERGAGAGAKQQELQQQPARTQGHEQEVLAGGTPLCCRSVVLGPYHLSPRTPHARTRRAAAAALHVVRNYWQHQGAAMLTMPLATTPSERTRQFGSLKPEHAIWCQIDNLPYPARTFRFHYLTSYETAHWAWCLMHCVAIARTPGACCLKKKKKWTADQSQE
jgi:hypothetical protein